VGEAMVYHEGHKGLLTTKVATVTKKRTILHFVCSWLVVVTKRLRELRGYYRPGLLAAII
jgi:hypothetical protein